MADTPTGETATQGDSQTTVTTTSAPVTDNAGAAEVERLRKEVEQTNLRNRQLENEKAARVAAETEAERKRLEEQEQFKSLYEKSAAELKELRDTQDRDARNLALTTATDVLLKDYPDNVAQVAKTTGLALSDDGEDAKASLREKLDAIKAQIGTGAPVTANNPHSPAPTEINREELVTKNNEGVSPMAMASARGDDSLVRKYISSLPQIEEMRRNAGLTQK